MEDQPEPVNGVEYVQPSEAHVQRYHEAQTRYAAETMKLFRHRETFGQKVNDQRSLAIDVGLLEVQIGAMILALVNIGKTVDPQFEEKLFNTLAREIDGATAQQIQRRTSAKRIVTPN